MSKRVELITDMRGLGDEHMQGSTIEVDDERAAKLIKEGRAKLSPVQTIYNHQDDMPEAERKEALRLLEVADANGGPREHVRRAAAVAEARKAGK